MEGLIVRIHALPFQKQKGRVPEFREVGDSEMMLGRVPLFFLNRMRSGIRTREGRRYHEFGELLWRPKRSVYCRKVELFPGPAKQSCAEFPCEIL